MAHQHDEPASGERPERRRSQRHSGLLPLTVRGVAAQVLDLSRGGLSLQLAQPLPLGTTLDLELADDRGERCPFRARVVWCVPGAPCRAGLEFVDLTAAQDRWLAACFMELLRRAGAERLPAAILLRRGRAEKRVSERHGVQEWEVALDDGTTVVGVLFPEFGPPLAAGDPVLVNLTATALGLGTGDRAFLRPAGPSPATRFPGREAGHQIKLRYTPLQHRVMALEDSAGPYHELLEQAIELDGVPVVCAELHSQMAAAAIAAHATAPRLRLVYVMTDGAALPLGWSHLVAQLRVEGVLAATITAGQAFGGDFEAISLPSALVGARTVLGADVIFVAQGPGNAGSGTALGFSGTQQADALHAAAALGGQPIAVVRASTADPRPRHRGVSHHSLTVLGRLTLCGCIVPLPAGEEYASLRQPLEAACATVRHTFPEVPVEAVWPALRSFSGELTTMGRRCDEDPLFFRCAAAAGIFAARQGLDLRPEEAT